MRFFFSIGALDTELKSEWWEWSLQPRVFNERKKIK